MAKLLEQSQVGKREDLRDVISNVDARKYPVSSMLKKGKTPRNTLVEWQVDGFPEPSFDGVLDGADVTTHENMAEQRQRLATRVQIFRRSPMVSLLSEEVSDVAGVGNKKEMARAIVKSIEMLKRDIECAICSDRDSQAQSGMNPYRLRGLGCWAQTAAQSDLPVHADYRTPAGQINTTATSSLTEANVNDVVANVWDQTGEDKTYVLVCGRALRSRISSFTQYQSASTNVMASVRTITQGAAERKLVSTIDILEGDFGTIEVLPTAWNARDTETTAVRRARGYLIDPELIELAWHTLPRRKPLPDQGGGPRELVYAVAALCVSNPLGLGKFSATS